MEGVGATAAQMLMQLLLVVDIQPSEYLLSPLKILFRGGKLDCTALIKGPRPMMTRVWGGLFHVEIHCLTAFTGGNRHQTYKGSVTGLSWGSILQLGREVLQAQSSRPGKWAAARIPAAEPQGSAAEITALAIIHIRLHEVNHLLCSMFMLPLQREVPHMYN